MADCWHPAARLETDSGQAVCEQFWQCWNLFKGRNQKHFNAGIITVDGTFCKLFNRLALLTSHFSLFCLP